MHLKHSREEPFSPAGSAALRGCPRRRHFSPDVLVLGLGFDWRPQVSSATSPPMFYTRPPRLSRGSAGWALKYSLLFPVSSSRIPRAGLRRQSFFLAALSGFIRRSGFAPPRPSSFWFSLAVDQHPNSSCPTSTPCCSFPRESRVNGSTASIGHWRPRRRFMGSCFARCSRRKSPCGTSPWASPSTARCSTPVALLVLSCTTPSDLPYLGYSDVSGAVRSILVDPWLLFCAGHLAFHFCKQKIDGARTGRRRRHLSFGCRRNILLCLFPFDVHTRHLGSISLCADHRLGCGGGLIAFAANRNRRSTATASPEAPAYWRTLGLITYPLYLTHNVIGTAIIRVLIDAGLDATLAVGVELGMLVLVCWLICAKIEPAIRRLLSEILSNFRLLPKAPPPSSLSDPPPGLRLPLPIRARVNFTQR